VKNRLGRTIQPHERVSLRIVQTNDVQGWGLRLALDGQFLDYTGHDALHTAHLVAPSLNAAGADPDWVRIAVRDIEVAGSAQAYFSRILKYGQKQGWQYTGLNEYPQEMRLAFEMASHEETERAALEGELAQLEADWREAEEIASISDNLFLPQSITDFISRAKR
jgi:hypothetical protein